MNINLNLWYYTISSLYKNCNQIVSLNEFMNLYSLDNRNYFSKINYKNFLYTFEVPFHIGYFRRSLWQQLQEGPPPLVS